MSRLEVDLFDPPPDPDLVCAICQCVIAEPTELERCRHIFCRVCIRTWLSRSRSVGTCPSCRASVCIDTDLHGALPALCNVIGRLMMSCIHQRDGCDVRVSVERLDVHLRDDCRYVGVRCVWCDREVMRCRLVEHEDGCDKRLVKCTGVCQMMVSCAEISTHNCAVTLKRSYDGLNLSSVLIPSAGIGHDLDLVFLYPYYLYLAFQIMPILETVCNYVIKCCSVIKVYISI